ncbi:MAG: hypothetical protein IJI73_01335, partial [Kiritimatiellae bacterium]|nr:hypothetical protein [Kiritimatiellia bacterium]
MRNEGMCRVSPVGCCMPAVARRLSIVACLALGWLGAAPAMADTEVGPPAVTNAAPALLQPVSLRDADGNAELDLVDPFRRRGDGEEG